MFGRCKRHTQAIVAYYEALLEDRDTERRATQVAIWETVWPGEQPPLNMSDEGFRSNITTQILNLRHRRGLG